MFLNNKYTKWYFMLIERGMSRQKPDGYTEKHHIIPKSFGGSNKQNNLVRLTPKEHFIAHIKGIRVGYRHTNETKSKMSNWQKCW